MLSRSWMLFGGGLISVPFLMIGTAVLNPQNKPWTAFVVPPLLFAALICCVAAPFLSGKSCGKKVACSVGALLAFGLVLFVTFIICVINFESDLH